MLESKYGSPKIVNDGVTVAKEVGGRYPFMRHSVVRILGQRVWLVSCAGQLN